MTDSQRRALWISSILAFLFLVGNQGFWDMVRGYREKRRLEQSVAGLRTEQERLARELSLIRKDPSYSEYLIRKYLRYVKKGEVEYRLLKKEH